MKKKLNIVTWFLIIVMGVYILFRGVCILSENQSGSGMQLAGYMEYQVGMKAVGLLFPNLSYPFHKEDESLLPEKIYKSVLKQLPVFCYVDSCTEYETETENQMTYEMIIQKEANDEYGYEIEESPVIIEETETSIKRMEEENKESKKETEKQPPAELPVDIPYQSLLTSYYNVENSTMTSATELDSKKLLEKDMTLDLDSEKPQILIYHTHSQEGFVDSVEGDSSTTVVGVGAYLAELLREKGFQVLHHTAVYDMQNGKLDRNKAYTLAEADLKQVLEANPSIEVVIDIHRDGLSKESQKLVTEINGKPTAKIMFVNGLSRTKQVGNIEYLKNPNLSDNLSFSLKLQMKGTACYPGLNRKILLKGYRYNLHLKPRTLLVEVGAQTNTLQEEKNAMEPLADILAQVLIEG